MNHLLTLILTQFQKDSPRIWSFQGDWVMLRGDIVGILSVKALSRAAQFNMSYPNTMKIHMECLISKDDLAILERWMEQLFGEGNWEIDLYED